MPIAKENLYIGFTVAATEGTYVTKDAVDRYGWSDKVEDGPDIGGSDELKDDKAPKGKPQKGS